MDFSFLFQCMCFPKPVFLGNYKSQPINGCEKFLDQFTFK